MQVSKKGLQVLAPERSKKDAQPVVANARLITHGKASNLGTTKPVGADQTRVAEAKSETRPHAGDAAEAARLERDGVRLNRLRIPKSDRF